MTPATRSWSWSPRRTRAARAPRPPRRPTPISAAPPVSLTPPSVSGDPVDGGTLTVDPGTYSGTGPIDYEYEWQRCNADGTNCVEIAGETGSSYILGPDDIGHTVVAVVTAGNAGGETRETSPSSPVVEAAPPHDTVAPVITGDVDARRGR